MEKKRNRKYNVSLSIIDLWNLPSIETEYKFLSSTFSVKRKVNRIIISYSDISLTYIMYKLLCTFRANIVLGRADGLNEMLLGRTLNLQMVYTMLAVPRAVRILQIDTFPADNHIVIITASIIQSRKTQNDTIIAFRYSLASRFQIATIQRHGDYVFIERGHYSARSADSGLDDVQRPDRERPRVVRREIHFFDVDKLGRPVVRVQRAFDQPPIVCEYIHV